MQTKNVKQSKRWFKGWTGPKLGRLTAKLPRRRRRMRKYNAFELKVFMAGLMIFDHLDHIPEFLSPEVAGLFHVLTRCVGVWFAYAAVESFLYTRSRLNYIARIFLAAAGMALGNLLLNRLGEEAELSIHNNIFLTLGLGVVTLSALAELRLTASPWRKLGCLVGATAIVALGCIFAEGGLVLLPFMLITFLCRKDPRRRNAFYLFLSVSLFAISYQPYPSWQTTVQMLAFNSDFLFITILPFLRRYNGKRGPKNTGTILFFYLFYPLHLWIIQIIALLVAV